jgi:photosystem II stability/assembly factor-like uncharacterized protein
MRIRCLTAIVAVAAVGLSIVAVGCSAPAIPPSPAHLVRAVPGATAHPNGPFPGLRYRDGGTATLQGTPPPASSALPGANDLLSTAATGTGGATVLAAADSGIWRSTDGGARWRREFGGIRAWSLTAIPGGGYAALGDLPLPSGASGVSAPVLATSATGLSWRLEKVAVPASSWPFGYGYRFALSGLGASARGVAVPDNGAFFGGATPGGPAAYRTADGGRRWIPLSPSGGSGGSGASGVPGASGGLAMLPDGRTVFATGSGSGSGCAGAVYKSADGGVTWALLPGSCQSYPLLAAAFVTPQLGFAAGGLAAKFGGGALVEATADGGRTWQVRWRTPTENRPNAATGILRLDMLSASQGWAASGGCVGGQNGPCPGTVYVTVDGGLRWQPTSQQAIAIAGLGAGRAIAADDLAQTTAVTVDGGRTWAVQTRPQTIGTSAFDGVGGAQFWATNLGDFLSRDGGSSWAAANELSASRFTYFSWQAAPPARLLGYSQNGAGFATWSSSDDGRIWTRSVVPGGSPANQLLAVAPGPGGAAVAVTGPGADCLSQAQIGKVEAVKPGWTPPAGASVLYRSNTGGAQWDPTGLVLPFGVGTTPAVAVSGSRIAIIDACDRLQLSADDGAHWTARALGSGMLCTVSQLRAEAWLACTDTGADSSGSWVLRSADGGSTWLAYRLPSAANAPYGIFATGVGTAVMPVGGSLWRTTDGGRSWTEYWPARQGRTVVPSP